MKKNKKLYKKLIFIGIAFYVLFILVNQQKTLNQYSQDCLELIAQTEEQKEYREELAKRKDDVNSLEFIEITAREKLDMYYPNERVYIDKGI